MNGGADGRGGADWTDDMGEDACGSAAGVATAGGGDTLGRAAGAAARGATGAAGAVGADRSAVGGTLPDAADDG